MIARPGTLPWLVAHDLRLSWRSFAGMLGEKRARNVWMVAILCAIVLHGVAFALVPWLTPWLDGTHAGNVPLATALACCFTWMTAHSLFGASRTLYSRGDLDLLLGSPLQPWRVLAAKAFGIAAGSFGSVALLVLPLANAGAAHGQTEWLSAYPLLAGLALLAAAAGISITIAIYRTAGPARARLLTQMTGAVIAGSFVLSAQVAAALPAAWRQSLLDWLDAVMSAHAAGPLPFLLLPMATARGDASAAALLVAIGATLFLTATALLGRSFAEASHASAGAEPQDRGHDTASRSPFRAGLASSLRRKEWRLLARDPGVFSQLSWQIIYTVPGAVILLRSETLPAAFALAPTIVVIAAQVAASLAWLTVSGEDAPELIATAPVNPDTVDNAKLTAVALPLVVILALPLVGLALISWQIAALTVVVCAAAATSTALLNFWHPMPSNRRGMLRRHSQSKLIGLAEHALSFIWASVIVLAMLSSQLALIPVAIAALLLSFFRRKGTRLGAA
jgi:ABC-2 type transport system permease protein